MGNAASHLSKQLKSAVYTGYGTITHFFMGQTKQIPQEAVKFTDIWSFAKCNCGTGCCIPACE